MNKKIYISTTAFQTRNLMDIIEISRKNHIENIELSACDPLRSELYDLLVEHSRARRFCFLIHNYFPPPETPFVLNLASNNPRTLEMSRQHCLNAIDLSAQLNAAFYSVHAGFCFHVRPEELGKRLGGANRFAKKDAIRIFLDSMNFLAEYADKKGIRLAIENNVLAPFNLIDGKNDLLLGVTADEMLYLLENVKSKNVGVLIDVGHLKVSARSLDFSPTGFLRDLSPHVMALHLSDNEGLEDTNQPITAGAWFWEAVFTYLARDVYWILEVGNLSISAICEQKELLESKMKEQTCLQ